MTVKVQRYGWIPDLPDNRDHMYAAPPQFLAALPTSVDLRKECPPVYDQGQLGSCTANAIGGAMEFEQKKQRSKSFTPSRLFIYYNERALEGTVNSDGGAQIRDGMKVVAKMGTCPETEWPYHINDFRDKPSSAAYHDAAKNKVMLYQRVSQTLNQMKGCLASRYPFVFGFTVYESFESPQVARSGHPAMPKSGEQAVGGHAVMAVGYDDRKQWFIVRNSWGTTWGMKGYFTMPYQYLLESNLADDFWTIRLVETPSRKGGKTKWKSKKGK
jgi:C1A family cysteine protease